jgi:hypothetical protein
LILKWVSVLKRENLPRTDGLHNCWLAFRRSAILPFAHLSLSQQQFFRDASLPACLPVAASASASAFGFHYHCHCHNNYQNFMPPFSFHCFAVLNSE